MTPKHQDIINETVGLLLNSLKKKITDGTATAAEQANFIKLVQESGFAWHDDASKPSTRPDLPTFDDEEDGPIKFHQAR